MTPPSPVHDVRVLGTHRVVHLDRRRLVLLWTAGAFLVIAVVFAVLALFPATAPAHKASLVPSLMPVTITTLVSPPAAAGSTVAPTPIPVTVTMTATTYVAGPPAAGGFGLGAAESLASALGTVVAAAAAVIALRPQRRTPPPAAAATDAPAGTTSS
jgi:hypothetical protein